LPFSRPAPTYMGWDGNTDFQIAVEKQYKTKLKGTLNPKFLNLTIEKNFGSRYVLVPFLSLLLLKSCKRTSPLTTNSKVLLGMLSHSVSKILICSQFRF